ncbi:hypothetical protein [Mycolicibacterium brumae]|uniref:Uncharacterized protein n=1 Tax=Mycolicibacterium brumae TaxID=85968 RepID=A0A2G5PD78_9MYCO|nr:hypothetical protein [Mycolicibacterium brumae]MCV7191838.1 hypothetical protein [Mycolicibacterium brumae]PIB76282.1 hypothetical protein CQY22_006060 [Mycolicibacterium brumae]RWA15783.1 hypothetical protein MBRU_09535 [Mycolicibacterium brumae DSM 44177]UWW07144.1 hypothetical protein L2Z93_000136 [Mycolicibacterium brumae]
MRIEINRSARQQGITDDEIRSAIEYPALVVPVPSRVFADAQLLPHIGRYADNEPLLEVVGEVAADTIEVFHAMLLRWATVTAAGIVDHITPDDIADTQRR